MAARPAKCCLKCDDDATCQKSLQAVMCFSKPQVQDVGSGLFISFDCETLSVIQEFKNNPYSVGM